MEQIAEQITESLIQELPKETDFFTPQELLSYGIPGVVVETLRKNLASTIESGMNIPATGWVQTDSEKVLTAWSAFVEISKQHIKIPESKISNLLGEAVEQCLELALKPRESVPEIIFRTRKTIDLEAAKLRVADLVVNQQLGIALLRYMEKKQKTELSRDEARELIKKIDEKLVENYHPLNWAQALKPIFELAGPAVNSVLFRIFFEDKEKPGIARKFDLLEKELNETQFIEFMSSAELLDIDDFEDSQSQLFVPAEEDRTPNEPEEEAEVEAETEPELLEEEEAHVEAEEEDELEEAHIDEDENFEETDEDELNAVQHEEPIVEEPEDVETYEDEPVDDETDEEPDPKDENIVDLFSQIKKGETEKGDLYYLEKEEESNLSLVESGEEGEDEDGDDNITLLNKFMFDESGSGEDSEQEEEDHNDGEEPVQHVAPVKKEPSSIYDEMNLVQENRQQTERMSDVFDEISDDENEEDSDEDLSYKIVSNDEVEPQHILEEPQPVENEITESDEKSDDDLPMWRSFLERDDLETESGFEYEEDEPEEELEDEEGFIEEPIYDLTATEPDPEEKLGEISKWLDDEKDRFVEDIFRGSEEAYEQALIEILDFDDWKSASHYLEREVFSRNRIDVYDEAAVDFTDRLHSYFMEDKS